MAPDPSGLHSRSHRWKTLSGFW